MNKNKKIIILIIAIVLVLCGIASFTAYKYISDKNAKIDKIVSVNVVDGIMSMTYDITEEELEAVKDTFPKLEFKEEGVMPKYHTSIVIKTKSGKEYMLKYSDTKGVVYVTGDMQQGFYSGADALTETLIKYEKQYGHGTIVTYGG